LCPITFTRSDGMNLLWSNYGNDQHYSLYRLFYYSKSGDVFAHHQEHLTVINVCVETAMHAVSTHPRHQPAATWVNTARYCKYSQVLLMMGENIAQNM
jgi:hypothetical protein